MVAVVVVAIVVVAIAVVVAIIVVAIVVAVIRWLPVNFRYLTLRSSIPR